jgi:hypothetical protein
MPGIVEFQRKMLSDPATRQAFAADPKTVLRDMGVTLPEGVQLPDTIDLNILNSRLDEAKSAAAEEGFAIDSVDVNDTASVVRAIEDTLPVRSRDLMTAKAIHESLSRGGEAATAAAVAVAVVAAVVAVPVATVGRQAEGMERINPAFGIERVSRGQLGLTVHGPAGLRIENLNVNEVANLIKAIR